MKEYISKSDFKVARTCPGKLYYKKNRYPSDLETDEYLKFLAEGGYAVGKLAQLLRPGGIEVRTDRGSDFAVRETAELLKRKNVTLYEAAVYSNFKLVRIDILEKKGSTFRLIEVKSKSWDSDGKVSPGKMQEYYEDVAFQAMVLEEAFPEAGIHSFLFLPDKAQRTRIEGLAGWFRKKKRDSEDPDFRFPRIGVEFIFPKNSPQHAQLQADNLLTLVNVDLAVAGLLPGIMSEAEEFIASVRGKVKKIPAPLNKGCFKCEFRARGDDPRDGYRECWGALADVSPHISELYYAGTIGGSKEPLVDRLIAQGRVSLYDIPLETLKNKAGEVGSRNERQLIQIKNTKANREWISGEMKEELTTWEYPLRFIDFETSISALPFHNGMRPYELIAFQWSCHTVAAPGAEPKHDEWINLEEGFPNFRFAESLMKKIGDKGTPLMWATHENTVLRGILEQMEIFGHEDGRLREWLERMTSDKGKTRKGRLVDMCAFTRKHYFHPQMKGSNSLKKVLPAVWQNHPYLRDIPWFRKYLKLEKGLAVDPYDTLAGDVREIGEEQMPTTVVRDGTGAMRAYYDMVFGDCRDDAAARNQWREKLLRYCELDTMSMVIVWTHWMKLSSLL